MVIPVCPPFASRPQATKRQAGAIRLYTLGFVKGFRYAHFIICAEFLKDNKDAKPGQVKINLPIS